MCGFVGYISKEKNKEKTLEKMLKRIEHRGPDSSGTYTDENIALGFRRLSIIDLEGGTQPIYNEKKDKLIFFNGEVYNFQELREDLLAKGHKFTTKTDTETILHGFEEYGDEIVKKLRGMFSFVIWDIKKQEMFAARDHFGIKPFYYYMGEDVILMGSEIKSFLEHPKFVKELNNDALRPYLTFQYSAMNETFFKNVFKLMEGHYMTYRNNKLEIKEYYDVEYNVQEKSEKEFIEEIKETLASSVEYHRISDVKVGSFLSGGVDSSYITGLLKPNKTFSVGFGIDKFSEVEFAKDLSKILKTKNVNKTITADEFFSVMEKVEYHSDEPHANLSAVPLYFLSEMTRKDVTVTLSGEGADELFGGYESYDVSARDKKYRKIPKFIRYGVGKVAKSLPYFKGREFAIRNGLNVEDYYIGQAKIFEEYESNKILNDEFKQGPTVQEITKPFFDKVKDKDDLTKMQYLDMHLWMPHDILLKADKQTMAHSIELRVPILDRVVMDLAAQIPTEMKLSENTTKCIFRKAAAESLPEEWAKRPKKGFPVPFSIWIREEKYNNIVKEVFERDYVSNFFDQSKILNLLEEHYTNQKNNGRKIYTIFAFLTWYKVYFIDEA